MNDDVIVINTNSPTKIVNQEQRIESLPVFSNFDNSNKVLFESLPEFDVTQIDKPEIQLFIKRLKKTMVDYRGLGLSANQCGYKFRMFVMGSEHEQMVCINPLIKEKGDIDEMPDKMREGCLSYPGLFLYVPRYKKVLAEYHDEMGNIKTQWFEGLTAQVYQHELDHMNGIVYTEHVGPLALKMAKDKRQKFMKTLKRKQA